MAIYWRCPECKSDQSIKNKKCKKCGVLMPKQNKTYRVVVKYEGITVTKTFTGSLNLAKEVEAKIKSELVQGTYYDRRQKRKESIEYAKFINEQYLPYTLANKKSYEREEIFFRVHILPVIGNKSLNKISPFDLEKVKRAMVDKKQSPRSIQYALAVIRQSFNKARDWGYFTGENPVKRVKIPKVNNKRTRYLTEQEAEDLLKIIKMKNQKAYEICLLSLRCGLRAGEIFNLKGGDIDFNNDIINIRDPKNNESRVAYMTKDVREILKNKNLKKDEYVFQKKDGGKMKDIPETFYTAVKALGLNDGVIDRRDKVVFHTLRHTFASWLAINGTPIYTIKELMGHKTLAMTERYSHLAPNAKREAINKLMKKLKH